MKACEQSAIETLMISDSLFRSQDFKTRSQYVKLLQEARESGANVLIFSSLHVSGNRVFLLQQELIFQNWTS